MEASNPYSPPSAPVRDIPSGSSTGELAGRGARLGASIIDGFLFSLLIFMPLVLSIGFTRLFGSDGQINYAALVTVGALAALPGLVLFGGFTAWLVAKNGQTVGKKLVGIKIVRTDGTKAGLGRIFWLRYVVITAVSYIKIVGGLIALVDVLLIFRESRKCLHDQIADTIVIKV
jgi:uncharacterized RDD family membrane protein YckC